MSMPSHLRILLTRLAVVPTGFLLACSSGTGSTSDSSNGGLSSTVVLPDGGTVRPLLCGPSSGQISACSGKGAGDACTLTDADKDRTVNGTCRPTIDGSELGCVPHPPSPPSFLTDPCSGKALGASCQATGPFGRTFQGDCVDAPFSQTLVCAPVRTPPEPAVEACSGLDAGQDCSISIGGHWGFGHWDKMDAGTITINGSCSNGPADAGPLACAPVRDHTSVLTSACSGLDAGASCTLGHKRWMWGEGPSGTCVVPAGGGQEVCLIPCGELKGHGFGKPHGWGWH